MTDKLKPCPFCGSAGEFYNAGGSYGYYHSKTGCRCSADCIVKPSVAFVDEKYDWDKRKHLPCPSKQQAAKAWNTRAQVGKPA